MNRHSNKNYQAEKKKAWQDYQELSKGETGLLKRLHAEVYVEELRKMKKKHGRSN